MGEYVYSRNGPVLDNEAADTNVPAGITVTGEQPTLPQEEGERVRQKEQQPAQCREEPPNYTIRSPPHA